MMAADRLNPLADAHARIASVALGRLATVMAHWQQAGVQEISLPWVAPESFVGSTRPEWRTGQDVETPYGQLVASGEQSFCWLARSGVLPQHGRFIGWTPCFRDEGAFDDTHHYGFLKAEVFAYCDRREDERALMVELARTAARIMGELAGQAPKLVPMADSTLDLELGGLEVGSYGVRTLPGEGEHRRYAYATALAEPRFSQAMARIRGCT